MFGINGSEWLIILAIVLILFGSAKLPELARAMGKSVNEFRKGLKGVENDLKDTPPSTPAGHDDHDKLISPGVETRKPETPEKQ